jgi:hypothetical protein
MIHEQHPAVGDQFVGYLLRLAPGDARERIKNGALGCR